MSEHMLAVFADAVWEWWGALVLGLFCLGGLIFLGLKYLGRRQQQSRPALVPVPERSWTGKDRRASPRFPVRTSDVLILFPNAEDQPVPATILDRSLGGVGLELKEEVEVGQRLQLRLRDWDPKAPWVVAEVRYCRPQGDSWRAGCQFVEISALEVMNIFGPPDPD